MTRRAGWPSVGAVRQSVTTGRRFAGPFAFACFLLATHSAAQTPSGAPTPLASNPQPIYPQQAARDAAIGRVEVEIEVGADGKARSSRVVHVAPVGYGFEQAVQHAVGGWVFEPARAADAPVAATYRHVFELTAGHPVSLAEWISEGDTDVSVSRRDSVTRIGRAGGWIHTRRYFSEYSLRLAFRTTKRGTKAGVLVHSVQDWKRRPAGYRISLTEDGQASESVGRIIGLNAPVDELAFDAAGARAAHGAGQWELLEVRSGDGRIETTLNGVPVCAIADGRFTGLIGFEVRDGAIEVRDAQIERLDSFQHGDFSVPSVSRTGNGMPKVVRDVKPAYTAQAMRDKLQGYVTVAGIVDPDGRIVHPRIVQSLDIDLDQTAVAAARQWRFQPVVADGHPVATAVSIQMNFQLR